MSVDQQKLSHSYQVVLDQLDIVAVTDSAGRITHANDKFCQISGYSREELLGQDHRILNSGTMPQDFFKDLWRTIASGRVWKGEICNRAKNGALYWVDTVIVPQLDPHGRPDSYLSIRRDITARKMLEKQILQSEKMASLGQMAASLAHELTNPLSILHARIGRLGSMTENSAPVSAETLSQEIQKLMFACDRILSIVKGMRSFSREGSADPFLACSVKDLLSDLKALCSPQLKTARIEFPSCSPERDCSIEARPSQILQILVNLINNATDAIESNLEKWIRLECKDLGDHIQVSITDSGSGIPLPIREKLFQAFFTTKEVNKGTGLGLSISKSIAEQHGGTLVLDEMSPNTRFVLTLPKKRQPAKDSPEDAPLDSGTP